MKFLGHVEVDKTLLPVWDRAIGLCEICRKQANDSFYWTPLSDQNWKNVRLQLAVLQEQKIASNNVFISTYNKPFCGPECVEEYHKL